MIVYIIRDQSDALSSGISRDERRMYAIWNACHNKAARFRRSIQEAKDYDGRYAASKALYLIPDEYRIGTSREFFNMCLILRYPSMKIVKGNI